MGPMSQDFHAAFHLNGEDDKHITTVDEGGVALAAIQGLNQKLEQNDAQIAALTERLEKVGAPAQPARKRPAVGHSTSVFPRWWWWPLPQVRGRLWKGVTDSNIWRNVCK